MWKISQWMCGFIVTIIVLIAASRVLSDYDFKSMTGCAILNTTGFLLGYSFLKPLKSLVFWKVALTIVIITIANWLLFTMWRNEWILLQFGEYIWFSRAIMPYVLSILLNIGVLKYLFGIETRKAIIMGALIGMVHAQSLIAALPISSAPTRLFIMPQ